VDQFVELTGKIVSSKVRGVLSVLQYTGHLSKIGLMCRTILGCEKFFNDFSGWGVEKRHCGDCNLWGHVSMAISGTD